MLCKHCGNYIDFNFSTIDIESIYCEKCWSELILNKKGESVL